MPKFEQMPKEEEQEEITEVTKVEDLEETESEDGRISGFEKTEPSAKVKDIISGFEPTKIQKVGKAEPSKETKDELKEADGLIEDTLSKIDNISENTTDEDFKDSVFKFVGQVIDVLSENRMNKVFYREKLYKSLSKNLKLKADKELAKVTEEANLLFEDTPEKRKKVEESVYNIEKRYIHMLKDIFKDLELGEEKGGTFNLE